MLITDKLECSWSLVIIEAILGQLLSSMEIPAAEHTVWCGRRNVKNPGERETF